MNATKTRKIESLLGIFPSLSQEINVVLKLCRLPIHYDPPVAQYFLTTLLGTDTDSYRAGDNSTELPKAYVPWPQFMRIPLNTSLGRDDLTMQTQLIQFDKHLLNPCDVSESLLDAEGDIRRKKKMTLSSRRS